MFDLKKINNSRINVPETDCLPTTANETYSMGQALYLSKGCLTKAVGTQKPTHISATNYTATATDPKELPCYRILDGMEFEVPVKFSSIPSTLVLGTKVTITEDALGVTDIVTNGVATISDKLSASNTSGDMIRIIFN